MESQEPETPRPVRTEMAEMPDHRVPIKFTQKSATTHAALTNPNLPEWHRNFLYYTWYARIPKEVWNNDVLKLDEPTAKRLMAGKPVELTPEQIAQTEQVAAGAHFGLHRGLLPTSDAKSVRYVTLFSLLLAAQQNQPQQAGE